MEALYLLESETNVPGVRLCPKLRRDHIWLAPYSKMKVNLAAQVRHTHTYNITFI